MKYGPAVRIVEVNMRDWVYDVPISEWRIYFDGQWIASFPDRIVAIEYAERTNPNMSELRIN